jgi:hypothetical protein
LLRFVIIPSLQSKTSAMILMITPHSNGWQKPWVLIGGKRGRQVQHPNVSRSIKNSCALLTSPSTSNRMHQKKKKKQQRTRPTVLVSLVFDSKQQRTIGLVCLLYLLSSILSFFCVSILWCTQHGWGSALG